MASRPNYILLMYIDNCPWPYIDDFAVCYLDDILMNSTNDKEHEDYVQKVPK